MCAPLSGATQSCCLRLCRTRLMDPKIPGRLRLRPQAPGKTRRSQGKNALAPSAGTVR